MKKTILLLMIITLMLVINVNAEIVAETTFVASVGSGTPNPAPSQSSGGGGGGGSSSSKNVIIETPPQPDCSDLVYGYPQGTHVCRVYNNCSVPKNLQVVSNCPSEPKLTYDNVCVPTATDTCEPQIVEKVVEIVKEVPLAPPDNATVNSTNSTASIKGGEENAPNKWWLWLLIVAVAAVILGFLFKKFFKEKGRDMDLEIDKINGVPTSRPEIKNIDKELEKVNGDIIKAQKPLTPITDLFDE